MDAGCRRHIGSPEIADSTAIPWIGGGMDITAIAGAVMPLWIEKAKALLAGQPTKEWNKDELNAAVAHIPDTPDETLR